MHNPNLFNTLKQNEYTLPKDPNTS
ncbi:hypothetical protein D5013_002584, partial [Listeria monocytogenes]